MKSFSEEASLLSMAHLVEIYQCNIFALCYTCTARLYVHPDTEPRKSDVASALRLSNHHSPFLSATVPNFNFKSGLLELYHPSEKWTQKPRYPLMQAPVVQPEIERPQPPYHKSFEPN